MFPLLLAAGALSLVDLAASVAVIAGAAKLVAETVETVQRLRHHPEN